MEAFMARPRPNYATGRANCNGGTTTVFVELVLELLEALAVPRMFGWRLGGLHIDWSLHPPTRKEQQHNRLRVVAAFIRRFRLDRVVDVASWHAFDYAWDCDSGRIPSAERDYPA
jgi:hypothetical protein